MKPSAGRVVHYVNDDGFNGGACMAAIVTKTEEDPSIVDLIVFDNNFGPQIMHSLHLDPAAPAEAWNNQHWHWPELVTE